MRSKILIVTVISALLISACASAVPAVEEVAESENAVEMEEIVEEVLPAENESTEADVSEDDAMGEVSFSQDVWPILEKYALAAHGGKGGVFLESYSDILGNVVPGNPEASLLYKALIGDGMSQMPPGNPLPDEMVQMIYDWIKQGAKDN